MAPVSKTQKRAMKLAGLVKCDDYATAAKSLESARLPGDGIPAGQTWRTIAKLSDSELLTLLQPWSLQEKADSVNDREFA